MSAVSGSSAIPPARSERPGFPRRLFGGPPGWGMHGVALVGAAGLLDGSSAPGGYLEVMAWSAFLLLLLGTAWLIRVGVFLANSSRGGRAEASGRRAWNWYVGPMLGAITLALVMQEVPLRLRFAVSRDAMTRLAHQAASAGPMRREWYEAPVQRAGAYDVAIVQVTADGEVDFHVPGTELFRSYGGFAYAPGGAPYDPEGSFEPLGGEWYAWHTSW